MSASLRSVLIEHRDEVVTRFVSEVQRTALSPPGVASASIVDHIPVLLDEIIVELGFGAHIRVSQEVVDTSAVARRHGEQRWGLGYDLEAVMREYGVLRQVILELAQSAGAVLTVAEFDVLGKCLNVAISEAVSEYVRYRDAQLRTERAHLEFLGQAGQLLSSSLDYHSTLTRLARLIVPQLADWCAVHVQGVDVAAMPIAHVDPNQIEVLRETFGLYPLTEQEAFGYPAALQTGQPLLVEHMSDEQLRTTTRSDAHFEALRKLGAHSLITVPLKVQSTIAGAITLASIDPVRRYADNDLVLVEELARRAAVAIDNARLYELSRNERARMEAATRAKDEFVAVVSHELRTPLNVIVGWIRLSRSGALPADKQEHALEIIERNANALNQLVSDLLDISRISSGRIRVNPSQVDLSGVVDIALEDARLALEAKRLHVHVDLDRRHSVLRADPDRLQQIVWNLLTNALKFTPKGGHVHVTLGRIDSDLVLEVRDDGIGIAPEFLPHVFEGFRYADAAATRPHRGLGVGLSITKHLVDLHGGSIEAKSDGLGRGTTVIVRLPISPLVSAASGAAKVPATAKQRSLTLPQGLEGLCVLVVDDEPDARELFRLLLESCGVGVRVAASVKEAFQELARYQPDVIVSDIGMPEDDGYSFISRLRASPDEKKARIPVIALTAFASSHDRTQALLAGFNLHLSKPVEPAELLTAVGDLAGRSVREPPPVTG